LPSLARAAAAKILQKLYQPEGGKIKVNGIGLELIGFTNWRTLLGVVLQQIKIFIDRESVFQSVG